MSEQDKYRDLAEKVQKEMIDYVDDLKQKEDNNLVSMALINVQLLDFNHRIHTNPEMAMNEFEILMNDIMNTMSLLVGLKEKGDEIRVAKFVELRKLIMEKKNQVVADAINSME